MGKKRVKAGTSRAAAAARRELFVEAYCTNEGNATQAAITAGYSAKTAYSAGGRMLKDVEVSAAIEKRRAETLDAAQKKTGLTVEGTLRELHGMVHSDLRRAFDPQTGVLLAPHQWPDDVARGMASVKVVEMAGGMKIDLGQEAGGLQHVPMYTKEVKLWDKNSAVEKAMKHFGLFENDNKQIGESLALRVVFGK